MAEKPKLDDLLPPAKRTRKPLLPQAEREELMIDIWLPHFVAFAFRIEDSIRAAFPKKNWVYESASQQAAKLVAHPTFTEKFTAHVAKLDLECAIDERFVLSGLYHQALANIFDYFQTDERGHLSLKDISSLPVEMQRNVKKVRLENTVLKKRSDDEATVLNQRVTFEIVDSQKAYALLGKAIGMFIERIKVDVNHNLADKLEAALDRVKQQRLEAPKEAVH